MMKAYLMRMREGRAGGGKGPLIQEEVSGTVATSNDQTLFQPVAVSANQRGEVRLQGGDGSVSGALQASQSAKQLNAVVQGYAVRRLTPLECERLQGMPDDHTKVPYRGKTADECPDTPRYRAIGNSMAVPVMRWIGERIALADGDSDMDYETFLKGKRADTPPDGFPVSVEMSPMLFDWQRAIVEWACRRGRACIFADCGLGKTAMQLEWARQEAASCDGSVLVLTPLAVAAQTVEEGRKFGISAEYVRDMPDSPSGVYVTNYEMMGHFDLSAFSGVVLDESSILKSHDSKTRNALTEALGDVPHVLCCTATPAPNDQMELGTHAEICGAMTRSEMLATFFTHDGGDTSKWRLKGHAEADFYRWMAGWAVMISSPADIGYSAEGYDLPELKVTEVHVETPDADADDGRLFALPAQGLTDARRARRESMPYKVEAIAEAVNSTPGQWCVWCELNDESSALADAIPDAVEVRGSDSPEHKADAMLGFAEGRYRVIVSKPSICGFGMNWQGCHQMAFCGLSYSYEQFYQATRRCWRFGQESDVDVYVFSTAMESDVIATIRRKEETMTETKRGMVEAMAEETERQLSGEADDDLPDCMFADAEGDGWQMLLGDCVERIAEIPDCSVGLSVFSPPFASLYTYSDSERDMGNCRTDDEFWGHFSYLIPELYRVLMPGRSACIHCMNLPRTKERDGVIGIRDFRGDIIRAFERAGFVYHSEVCIWKDPVTAMQRTKALGLLHKTIRKDSSMSRQGIPDYVVVMRKPGQNPEPISHTSDEFPVSLWQRWASPVWSDINQSRTLNGRNARENGDERHICPLQLDVIERCVGLWSNPGDLVLSPFAGIGSEGYQSVLMGREFIGIELKPSYFRAAVVNLREVESQAKQQRLF